MSDFRKTDGEPPPLPPRQMRRRFLKRTALFLAFAAILFACMIFIRVEQTIPATGYVTSEDYAEVRAPHPGRIAEIRVETGMDVSTGETLVRMDGAEASAMLEQAKNQAERARARIERLHTVHENNRLLREKSLALAELRFKDATARLELAERLSERGLASGISVEERRLAMELAGVELEALKTEDAALDEKELAVLQEELKAAKSAVELHRVRQEGYLIRAPVSGKALRHDFVIGEVVGPDAVLYEIFGGKLVMKIMIAERHATLINTGQQYRAQLTPFRGLNRIWFHGEVIDLSGIIETRGNRTGRFATCSFEPGSYQVNPGCSADVKLFTGKAPLWRVLLGVHR